MLVKTFKVRKKGLVICGGILIALLVILVVFGIVSKATAKTYSMKTEKERQKFMNEMGWEVSEEYTSCKVVSIPKEFNDTYENYNEIQKEQGFNLKKYKGEMVEIYTYEVYNYPGNAENVVINLMVFEGELIGGDVSCNELDGFMQGLKNPDPDNKKSSDKKKSDSSDSSKSESKKDNSSSSDKKSSKSDKSDKKESKNTFDSSGVEESSTDISDSSVTEESNTETTEENTSEITSETESSNEW